MRVLTVVGNRPQFMKAAAVSPLLRAQDEEVLVHTGQHHDAGLSDVFFDELGLPGPDHDLGVAGGTNSGQLARMLAALPPLLEEVEPDLVLVYGDTNSTLAGALAGVQTGRPVAHVEAGMRSGDLAMPEERNRLLTDHLSTLMLCSSEVGARHLAAERADGTAVVVGDVMVDVALRLQPVARARTGVLDAHGLVPRDYLLATAHRAGNVDDPARLRRLVELLVGMDEPVVLPLHPRTRARLDAAKLLDRVQGASGIRLLPPLGPLEFTALLCSARAVLTDSGGVQKEAYLAGVPCITLRPSTEWIETVAAEWNTLADLDLALVRSALGRPPPSTRPPLYGDGRAGERVVAALRGAVGRNF